MELNEILRNELIKNRTITTFKAVELGISKMTLTNYVRAGLLKRIRHGVYCLPSTQYDELYEMMKCSDRIIFSHETALFLNGFLDKTTMKNSVTIPNHASLAPSLKDSCQCYYVKPELYKTGLITQVTSYGNVVRCYNIERTICDLLRSSGRCGSEMAVKAIKKYFNAKEKNIKQLIHYAGIFGVKKKLDLYIEILL